MQSLAAWLGRRRAGLRKVSLKFPGAGWGSDPGPALRSLAGSQRLESLVLARHYLGAGGGNALLLLGGVRALTRVELRGCGLCEVPAALCALPALAELCLAGNDSLGDFLARQQESQLGVQMLQGLRALTRMDLSGCGLAKVPAQLKSLPKLAELHLGANRQLGMPRLKKRWQVLPGLTGLTRLELASCGLQRLPLQLGALGALRVLGLGRNEGLGLHSPDDYVEVFQPLRGLSSLVSLSLVGCSLWLLPRQLSTLSRLEALLVDENDFCEWASLEEAWHAAWQPLRHLPALRRLSIRGCSLESLPAQLAALGSLEVLDVRGGSSLGWGDFQLLRRLPRLRALELDARNLAQARPLQLAALLAAGVSLPCGGSRAVFDWNGGHFFFE